METKPDLKTTVQALAALAQESRLTIFRLLVEAGPTGVAAGEAAAELGLAPATLSFHLKELCRANLISARQDGRYIYYSANFKEMGELVAYLTENCCARDGLVCGPAGCAPPNPSAKPAAKAAVKPAVKPALKSTLKPALKPKRKGVKA